MDILLLEGIHSGMGKFFQMFQQNYLKNYFLKKKTSTVEILLKGIFITDFEVKIIVSTKQFRLKFFNYKIHIVAKCIIYYKKPFS